MEPITHALTSLALSRAGLSRATRMAAPMLLVSGLAADTDWISYFAGAPAFLQWHRTATHSVLGVAVISIVSAAVFWLCSRGSQSLRIDFLPAVAVCACGSGMHLLLDLTNDSGVKLLWPFRLDWHAWDLARDVDPVLLAILLAGILVPSLLNLIGEEIGAGRRRRPGAGGAALALGLMLLYLGGRAAAHQRATILLNGHTYRQEAPIRTGAFPSVSPVTWHGVVETQTALHRAEVSLWPGMEWNAEATQIQPKPDDSPVLQRALASEAARQFLAYARFPSASVQPIEDGFEVWIQDLRDSPTDPGAIRIVAVIMLNSRGEVTRSELRFASETSR
jgi:membrane-bound metal-dependent hydrolase YbcI (DUF457 family)